MAEGSRKSKREVKLNRKEGFLYDEECLAPLSQRNTSWQHSVVSESVRTDSESDSIVNSDNSVVRALTTWSEIDKLPLYLNQYLFPDSYIKFPTNSSVECNSASLSQNQESESQIASSIVNATVQCSSSDVNKQARRLNSSTRLDFLDLDNYYLSAGSSSAISIMSESEEEGDNTRKCGCSNSEASGCEVCTAPELTTNQLAQLVVKAIDKIDALNSTVKGLENRLGNLEAKSDIESDVRSVRSRRGNKVEKNSSKNQQNRTSAKNKNPRVSEAKGRSYDVLVDKLRTRDKSKVQSESEVVSSSEEGEGEDLHGIRNKLDKKQRKKRDQRVNTRIKQAGGLFTDDDYEAGASGNSGTESDISFKSYSSSKSNISGQSNRQSHKVRSGAKVKSRPVVRTELWPHTIAVEEEGGNITCDNISLSKFYSCFTQIVTDCESKTEKAGRTKLLNAISTVLDVRHWPDAHLFHNLVMVKVEQDRISWKDDFKGLADQFIEKRVRQLLKNQGSSQRTGAYRGFSGHRSFGRGSGGYGGRSEFSGQRSPYQGICKQWNFGTCTFGSRCRYKHCCWSCYENGKTGDLNHRAASHDPSPAKSKPGEQNA